MNDMIICIGRQYGSGGREIGEKLAARLGVTCYDKLLLKQAAKEGGVSLGEVERQDEKPVSASAFLSGNVFADSASIGGAFYSQSQLVYDAEKEAIDELMPGEAWACYDPTISDPVKFEFDTQAFRADVKKYVGVWLSVGKKCAGTYLDATMALTYPFFYPYREYRVSGYYVQMGMSDAYDAGWCDFDPPESRSLFPRILASLSWRFGAKGAMQIPVVGWLFNMGVIVWTMLFFALREMYWGRWRRFGTALLPVLLWGTFLLGPVMAGRYIYPFVCALPVLAARPGRSVKEAARHG